jgi:hypothetical protein
MEVPIMSEKNNSSEKQSNNETMQSNTDAESIEKEY